jgi:hypothetical protein
MEIINRRVHGEWVLKKKMEIDKIGANTEKGKCYMQGHATMIYKKHRREFKRCKEKENL